jgi:hypothetical protein
MDTRSCHVVHVVRSCKSSIPRCLLHFDRRLDLSGYQPETFCPTAFNSTVSGKQMPGESKKKPNKRRKGNAALYTLAGTVITTLGAIATSGKTAILLPLIAIAAILAVFTLVLAYQWWQDRQQDGSPPEPAVAPDLHPEHLAESLTPIQRECVTLALNGAVTDVANVVGMPADLVRANLFSQVPNAKHLCMVKDLWCHMDRASERKIRIAIGRGSTGIAWRSGDANRVIWNDGWGESDIGNNAELRKVHPDLRWILSVPIFGTTSPATQLTLNIDGLQTTPSEDRLATALGHLPRFGQGIARAIGL